VVVTGMAGHEDTDDLVGVVGVHVVQVSYRPCSSGSDFLVVVIK
jgi:hypothetical protein